VSPTGEEWSRKIQESSAWPDGLRLVPLRVGVIDPELIAFGQRENAHFKTELHQSLHWTVHKPLVANNTVYSANRCY
jgi:hypothetical protein